MKHRQMIFSEHILMLLNIMSNYVMQKSRGELPLTGARASLKQRDLPKLRTRSHAMRSALRARERFAAGPLRVHLVLVLALFVSITSPQSATGGDWAANYGGFTGLVATRMTAVDASGNAYVAGTFYGATCTIDSVTLTRIGSQDAFVAKLDAAGTVLWAKNFGGSGSTASAQSIAVDASGNVYLGGYFYNSNLTTPGLTKIGNYDAFAIKLDSSGAVMWARNFGGSGTTAYGQSIAVDGSGNVYLGGYF